MPSRNLYSLRIFAHASLTSSAGIVGPVVPAGFIYVLRDVDIFESADLSGATFEVLNALGGVLWVVERTSTANVLVGQWRGRQVYAEGEQVGFRVLSGTWAVQASGYQLTTP